MPSFEVERLAEALGKSPAAPACPACGSEEPSVETMASVMVDPRPTAIRALAVACSSCGLIRFHAVWALDQYMDPRDDESGRGDAPDAA